MVALACASPLDDGLVDDIEYLVKKKKADCTIVDVAENTPVNNNCDNNSLKQFFSHENARNFTTYNKNLLARIFACYNFNFILISIVYI